MPRSLYTLALIVASLTFACRGSPASADASARRQEGLPATRPEREAPLPRTTDPELALRNLDARIEGLEKAHAARPGDPRVGAQLVEELLVRARYLGRPEDLAQAVELADAVVKAGPERATSYLVRARALAAAHRFDEALADAARAEVLGFRGNAPDALRAQVHLARDEVDEALAIRKAHAEAWPNVETLGALGATYAAASRLEDALAAFEQALASYRDVSPFPVAWILFQRGEAYQGANERERAKQSYRAALEVLPRYAPAAVHLADLESRTGERDRAIARLRVLVEASADPEALSLLAGLTQDGELQSRAAARWKEVLALVPEAYAHHVD